MIENHKGNKMENRQKLKLKQTKPENNNNKSEKFQLEQYSHTKQITPFLKSFSTWVNIKLQLSVV